MTMASDWFVALALPVHWLVCDRGIAWSDWFMTCGITKTVVYGLICDRDVSWLYILTFYQGMSLLYS